jgi:hypothetical protein
MECKNTAGKSGAIVFALLFCAGIAGGAAEGGLVHAELISETMSARPGSVVTIALRLEIAEGRHILASRKEASAGRREDPGSAAYGFSEN